MALRGFLQRRGDITDLIGRLGQTTSGLPSGTQENAVLNNIRIDVHNADSFTVPVFGLIALNQPRDDISDKSSYQINQPYGFIDVNQPRSFNVTGGGGGGGGTTTYYKMRGYFVSGAVYETYVVTGSPSSTPPSGHTLIDVAIVATWQI
jgi:hypothetical protein